MIATASIALALPQRPPDSPLGDILGWLIVFFVVIWPIVRGLLDNAAEQRKKFEEQQRRRSGKRTKGGGSARTERRSRIDEFLEEMISARPDTIDVVTEEEEPPARPVVETPPPRRPRPRTEPRPEPEPIAPAPTGLERSGDLDRLGPALGGDPFDEGVMERDLVPDEALVEVPAEDVLEVSGPAGSSFAALDHGPSGDEIGSERRVRRTTALERIQSGRTPWQAAFVLKEILGPPASARPHDDLPR